MVGYGPEDTHFVFELTYNYGIKSYTLGNDYREAVIHSKEAYSGVESARLDIVTRGENEVVVRAPDGYR